jgi:hypothetical protein
MPDIVEECRRSDQRVFIVGKPEPAAGNIGKEHGPKRVFEPRVVCAGIHKIREAELPNVAETLEYGGIEQGEREILNFNVTVDRVLDDLHKFTT